MALIDQYGISNADYGILLYSAQTQVGQTIKIGATNAWYPTLVSFWMYKSVGSPTGPVTAKIYATTGTYGSYTNRQGLIATSTNSIDASAISGIATQYDFTFSGTTRLEKNVMYIVTLDYAGGDASNRLAVQSDQTSPTHGGVLQVNQSGSFSEPTIDTCFALYGNVAPDLTNGNMLMMFQ